MPIPLVVWAGVMVATRVAVAVGPRLVAAGATRAAAGQGARVLTGQAGRVGQAAQNLNNAAAATSAVTHMVTNGGEAADEADKQSGTAAAGGGGCNGGCQDQDRCRFLKRKIENLSKNIERRMNDLDINPQGLPERIGPGEKLSQTRRGHRTLINKDWNQREKYQKEYDKKCK